MVKTELAPAYVLHRRAYRETSLLVEAFTGEAGRVGLVARGARRAGSAFRGLLEPFVPLLLSWSMRGELGTLTGAEPAGPARPLPPRRTLIGLYLNELLVRLMQRHDPHPTLFLAYESSLRLLGEGASAEPVLRVFEKRLLAEIGYAMVLDRDADTGAPIEPEGRYRYLPDLGPVPRAPGADGPGVAIRGATLLALESERLAGEQTLAEAKRLMRVLLGEHLGGEPLRSRAVLESLNRS